MSEEPDEPKNDPVNEENDENVAEEGDDGAIAEEAKPTEAQVEAVEEVVKAAPRISTVDWPLRGIDEPHDNDVLFGRGGGTNHHPGNKRYRQIVEDRKLEYVDAKRLDKPLVALDVIRLWRSQDPPGRFLKLDEKTGTWYDVGDKKAREKTSQALREKAPEIRLKLDEEKRRENGDSDNDEFDESERRIKSTRFAKGTNVDGSNGTRKPLLARDHTLGREFLGEGEEVTLDGFSWQDPFRSGTQQSQRGSPNERVSSNGPPPPPGQYPHEYRYPSHGSVPPPMAYGHGPVGSDRYPSGRFESWGSNYSMPPPPVPAYGYPPHHSGSWSQRDGSWSHREHSFSRNPLPHASVRHPVPAAYFDTRTGSWGPPRPDGYTGSWGPPPPDSRMGSWGPPPPGRMGSWGPPPDARSGSWGPLPPDGRMGSWGPAVAPPYGPPSGYYHSGGHPPPPPSPPYGSPPAVSRIQSSPIQSSGSKSSQRAPPSPSYAVDPKVASKWSGQDEAEIKKSWSAESSASEEMDRFDPRHRPNGRVVVDVRPDLVKRATSNQYETVETKPNLVGPSVKRAALNRDSSAAANRLKEQYVPGFKKSSFNADKEVKALSQNLEQSWPGTKPESFLDTERQSTIDKITMDLITKPVSFADSSRSNTIDALNIDFDDGSLPASSKPATVARSRTMEEVFNDLKDGVLQDFVPKPSTISGSDRITTNDYLAIIKEPIDDDGLDDDDDDMALDKPLILSRETSLTENWVAGV